MSVARVLLARMRETPMRRGGLPRARHRLKSVISRTIAANGIPGELAERISFQLTAKFHPADLGDATVWSEIARLLRHDVEWLRNRLGLADRQITVALPKLSADQIEHFHDELAAADRRIARTILNAALDAADPITAGRHYLSEYRKVVEQLGASDPGLARTLANATFAARAPRRQAVTFLRRIAELMTRFNREPGLRRMAKLVFRSSDPVRAAQKLINERNAVVKGLVAHGVDVHLARAVADLRGLRESS